MPLYRAELLAKKPLRYAALIHDVSQVLYLPFDWDDGSYARDRSGTNIHGTIYGATLAAGKIGLARDFDGVDDYVKIPKSTTFDVSQISVCYWIKPAVPIQPTGTGWATVIKKISGDWYDEFNKANGLLYVRLFDDTGALHSFTSAKNKWEGWTFVSWTYDGSKFRVYVNGALDNEILDAFTLRQTTEGLYIGQFHPNSQMWHGIIDEVRVYNRPLSDDEICMLMYRRLV